MSARLEARDLAGAGVGPVSLRLDPGSVLSVLGANGAGKSRLLRLLAGADPAAAGSLRLDGAEVGRLGLGRRARAGIAWCPEGRRLFPGLTVVETLDVAARGGRARRAAAIANALARFPVLAARRDARAWQLSGGQQQMLAIARAVIGGPRVLLLDEPSLGLAPAALDELFDTVAALAASGMAVVLAEQAVGRALAAADRALVLARGAAVLEGPASEVEGDRAFAEALIG